MYSFMAGNEPFQDESRNSWNPQDFPYFNGTDSFAWNAPSQNSLRSSSTSYRQPEFQLLGQTSASSWPRPPSLQTPSVLHSLLPPPQSSLTQSSDPALPSSSRYTQPPINSPSSRFFQPPQPPSNSSQASFPNFPPLTPYLYNSQSTQQQQQQQQQENGSRQYRRPVPVHQDNWLDRTTTGEREQDRFGYFPDLRSNDDQPSQSQSPFDGWHQDGQPASAYPPPSLNSDNSQMSNPIRRRSRPNVVDLTGLSSPPNNISNHNNSASTSIASPTPPAFNLPPLRSHLRLQHSGNDKRPATSSFASSSSSSSPAASASASGPVRKRARVSSAENIEEVDLTVEPLTPAERLRQAQQQEAIRSQQAAEKDRGPQRIGQRQCIICMENYTNATTTTCGHFYCHECLTQALIASEQNSDRSIGSCPVCRKTINRKKAHQLIPVSFMKKETYDKIHGRQ